MMLGIDITDKVTKPDFRKKFFGGSGGGKPPFLGVYGNFLENVSNDFNETLHDVSRLVGATFDNSGIFGKILNPGLIRCEKPKIRHFLSN